jgi:hypothetical protein
VPVYPGGDPGPLAPRRRERVGGLGRGVHAAYRPPGPGQRGREGGGSLRRPARDQQRLAGIMQEGTPRPATVRRLPPAEQRS